MILERLPDSRYSRILPAWASRTVVLIGGGSSLTREQVDAVRGAQGRGAVHTIAINASYLWAPWADVLYFADAKFFRWHTDGVPIPRLSMGPRDVQARFAAFAGQKCSIRHSEKLITDDAVHLLISKAGPAPGKPGISNDPGLIIEGKHSGYQALNIAILAGASSVILLGYDGKVGGDGQSHFHGGHPQGTPIAAYQEYRRAFTAGERAIQATGVRVINCSPGTAIDTFPKADLQNALACISD